MESENKETISCMVVEDTLEEKVNELKKLVDNNESSRTIRKKINEISELEKVFEKCLEESD